MRSSIVFVLLSISIIAFGITASAQVDVTATVGTPATTYTTLKGAFDAVNAGTHGGDIVISITANTTETAACVLNSNAATPAAYTSVLIRPTVDGVTISGAGSGGGRGLIELNGADNVTIDGDNPNTGGINRNLTLNNTSVGTYHQIIRVALNTTTVASADNNTFRNLALVGGAAGRNIATATSTTGTENTTYGVYVGANASGATTVPNTISSVSTVIGTGATAANLVVDNNTITSVARGVAVQGSATTVASGLQINNNIIGNPTAGDANGVYSMGITAQGSGNAIIRGNTIYVEWFVGTQNRAIDIGSISSTITAATIERNRVMRVRNNNTGTFGAYGINLAGGNTHVVRNNFVSDIKHDMTGGGAFSTTFGVFGIRVGSGTGHQIYNNSVNLFGTYTGTASANLLSAALGIIGTGQTGMDVRNNILSNTHASGASSIAHVSLFLPSGGTSAMNLTLNNNDYRFGTDVVRQGAGQAGTSAGIGFFTTFDPTMTTPASNLRSYSNTLNASGNDTASLSVDPSFISDTDLHVSISSPVLNVGATIASVIDDIDGDARPLQAVYEIGADERLAASLPGDFRFSSATYSGNEGTSVIVTVQRFNGSTGAVSVDYTTTNGTATGGACGAGGDYVGPTGPTTLNFADTEVSKTFTVVLCTDLAVDPSETVNLALSNPMGGGILGTPNTAVLTITDIPPPFSGAYTVGGGGQFPSLTNTGGIFEAINLAGASGPVTINITSDLTGETGAVALNPIVGNPAVLIKPSGAPRTISGVAPIALIRINGADNVRIDGSTAAAVVGGNAALRELTVQNLSTSTASGVIHIGSATESSNGNTVKNVNVIGSLSTVVVTDPATLVGISTGGAAPGSGAAFVNNDNTIENCSVRTALFGIASLGIIQATPNTGTVITQNDLTGTGNARIKRVGIFIHSDNGGQVTQNSIGGIDNTGESSDAVGIGAGNQAISDTTTTTTIGVQNMMIARNKINGVSNDATFSAVGIIIAGVSGATNTIANNMISGVTSDGDSGDLPTGIFVTGVTGAINRLYYNTVSMTGDRSALLTPSIIMSPSFALSISGTDPIVELRNNIFYTTQTATTGGVDARSYAIGTNSTTFANLDSDYNDFFSTGAQDGGFRSGSLDRAADVTTEVDYATVALWSAAVSDDVNSAILGEVDPMFINPVSDLHVGAMSPLVDKGIAVSVLDDFDGQIRSVAGFVGGIPDIGGDEFVAPTSAPASVRGRLISSFGRNLANATVAITNTSTGETRYTRSNQLGFFNFQDLQTGDTYVVSVQSKRFVFANHSFTLNDDLTDLVLTALTNNSKQ